MTANSAPIMLSRSKFFIRITSRMLPAKHIRLFCATEILSLQQKAIVELANKTKPQLRIGASSVPSLHFLKNKGLSLNNLNVIAVMDDAAALKQCIMLGMGISILSKATVQADARQGKLLLFPLGEAAFLRKLYLVYSPVKYMAEEGGVFLEFAKRFYQL